MRTAGLLLSCVACAAAAGLHDALGVTMSGDVKPLSEFSGRPVLMINVASL